MNNTHKVELVFEVDVPVSKEDFRFKNINVSQEENTVEAMKSSHAFQKDHDKLKITNYKIENIASGFEDEICTLILEGLAHNAKNKQYRDILVPKKIRHSKEKRIIEYRYDDDPENDVKAIVGSILSLGNIAYIEPMLSNAIDQIEKVTQKNRLKDILNSIKATGKKPVHSGVNQQNI